jgi:ABC-type dipeptide/oligopeptide/nickel transport system permease component
MFQTDLIWSGVKSLINERGQKMFRKVIVYVTVISFFFAVNISAASMERKTLEPMESTVINYEGESNSASDYNIQQASNQQISDNYEMYELAIITQLVGWKSDDTIKQKIIDSLTVTGWGLSWPALFIAVAAGGILGIVIALIFLAISSFTGPFGLESMLSTDDADNQSIPEW